MGLPRGVGVAALAAGLALALVGGPASPAVADGSAAAARADARAAAADVRALQARARAALLGYEQALDAVAGRVSETITAQQAADEAARLAASATAVRVRRVRALYMSGGSAALYATLLDAKDAGDAASRLRYVERVVGADRTTEATAAAASVRSLLVVGAAERAARTSVVTAAQVEEKWQALQTVLAAGQARLARLGARARALTEAEEAAAALAKLLAEANAAGAASVARAKATGMPPAYRRLYVGAARTCPGLPWTALAAVGQVESGHGRNVGPSSSGAMGPMQFLPTTFARYAVDGDRDGDADILDPADSIYTAARYLCANHGGEGEAGLRNALWYYNHAQWYVELVLRIAAQLAGQAPPAAVAAR